MRLDELTARLAAIQDGAGAGRAWAFPATTREGIVPKGACATVPAAGARAWAMGVSSPGLEIGRISGVRCAAAVFANISRDHLAFPGTMEDYFQAKRRLFCPPA